MSQNQARPGKRKVNVRVERTRANSRVKANTRSRNGHYSAARRTAPGTVRRTASGTARRTRAPYIGAHAKTPPSLRFNKRRGSKLRKILLGVACGILVIVVAVAIAINLYLAEINTNIGFNAKTTEQIKEVLVAPQDPTEPFYLLILGSDSRDSENSAAGRSDTILLARIDPKEGSPQVTLLSIPRDTEIQLPGYGAQKINAAFTYGGEAGAIAAVSELCGVAIAHIVEIDFSGMVEMVDTLGGVEVKVPLETSYAGVTIQPGKQILNGEQALTFSRSRNFPRGDYQRVINQRLLVQAIAKKVLASSATELPGLVQALSRCVKTDLSATDALQLLLKLKDMNPDNMYMDTIPSYTNYHDDTSYIAVQEPEFSQMMARVNQGLSPTDPDAPVNTTTSTGTSNDPTIQQQGAD